MKALITAMLAVGAVLVAPTASADTDVQEYLGGLHDAGLHWPKGNDLAMVTTGLAACVDLLNGVPRDSEVSTLSGALDIPAETAQRVLNTAVEYLCPNAGKRIGGMLA